MVSSTAAKASPQSYTCRASITINAASEDGRAMLSEHSNVTVVTRSQVASTFCIDIEMGTDIKVIVLEASSLTLCRASSKVSFLRRSQLESLVYRYACSHRVSEQPVDSADYIGVCILMRCLHLKFAHDSNALSTTSSAV